MAGGGDKLADSGDAACLGVSVILVILIEIDFKIEFILCYDRVNYMITAIFHTRHSVYADK